MKRVGRGGGVGWGDKKKFMRGKMPRKKIPAIHAEGWSNCDVFRKSEFLSESLSFRNQQYYQAQYE